MASKSATPASVAIVFADSDTEIAASSKKW